MEHTLLLNATYEPLQVVSWKRAIRMLFQEKVEVVEHYSREVRSVSMALPVPSVIRLLYYVRVRRQHARIKFSRANLFARDRFQCQYCGIRRPFSELTYDHVVPVAQGGRKTWENIVTSCVPCNRRKRDRLPHEADMKLRSRPTVPRGFPAKAQLMLARIQAPESWKTYIFWDH